jgi:hypothetical protein
MALARKTKELATDHLQVKIGAAQVAIRTGT